MLLFQASTGGTGAYLCIVYLWQYIAYSWKVGVFVIVVLVNVWRTKLDLQGQLPYKNFKELSHNAVPSNILIRINKCHMHITVHTGELIVKAVILCHLAKIW